MERLKLVLEFIQRRKKLVGFFTIIVLVVFFVTISKVYHYSEKSEFCASCHEMKIHYDSFKASKHHNEHVENCHACHVGPGLKGYAHAKLSDGTHDSLMHSFQAYTDGHLGVVHPHMPGDLFKAYAARKIKPYGTYEETDCLACHKMATPDVVKEWTKGAHAVK